MSQLSVKPLKCPYCEENHFSKRGYFYKKSTKTYIPRYICLSCRKSFSTRTLSATYNQKRPDLNPFIYKSLCSGVSLRQTARLLNCNYKTVYLKFIWLAELAKAHHLNTKLFAQELQFDEMETIEHTKLKPLSIALAVNENYQILGASVSTISAKGNLSEISIKKYGPRVSNSRDKLKELLTQIKSQMSGSVEVIQSDKKPEYKGVVKSVFKSTKYIQHHAEMNKEKKREQKYLATEKHVFDPLFKVNHMCARFRDHIKRLTRRSWCTTKKQYHLELNIYLYIAFTNEYRFI